MKLLWLSLFLFCATAYADPSSCEPIQIETEEEQISAYQCRQRVREMASRMRTQAEKMVRDKVPNIFQKIKILRQLYPYIDTLERNGIKCCQSGQSCKCCVEPLVQEMKLWNSKGSILKSKE